MRHLLTCLVLLAMATTVLAQPLPIPTNISYQGRLTSSTGTPVTGNKTMTFRIYDGGGAMIWMSGAVPVVCTDGLFSVTLGGSGMPAITPDILETAQATLGITIESDPELSPRTPLTSSPYAYKAVLAPYYLPLGGGTLTGDVKWDFAANDVAIEHFPGSSAVTVVGGSGPAAQLSSDGNGAMELRSSTGGLNVQAVSSATLGGAIALYSPSGAMTHMLGRFPGDLSTQLPDSAISAPEILDEPGLAATYNPIAVPISGTTMFDLVTVTITTPAAGYITIEGKGYGLLSGTTGKNVGIVQIDEVAGGSLTAPYFQAFGAESFPSTTNFFYPFYVTRTYFKPAGTYTFRMEGAQDALTAAGAVTNAAYPMIQAMFLPTSYGSVVTAASSDELGPFEQVQTVSTGSGIDARGSAVTTYRVDLRELELKAAKAEAAAKQAKMELLQAQLKPEPTAQANR